MYHELSKVKNRNIEFIDAKWKKIDYESYEDLSCLF